jgi:hypothetical protein
MDPNAQTLATEGIRRVHKLWFDEEEDEFARLKITEALKFLSEILPETEYSHLYGLWQAYLSAWDAGVWKLSHYRWRLFSEALEAANKDLSAIREEPS